MRLALAPDRRRLTPLTRRILQPAGSRGRPRRGAPRDFAAALSRAAIGLRVEVEPAGRDVEGSLEVVWQPAGAAEQPLFAAPFGGGDPSAVRHEIRWDGFGTVGAAAEVFDTRWLRGPAAAGRLLARARVRCARTGRLHTAELLLRGRPAGGRGGGAWSLGPADWLDLRLDRGRREAEVTLYLRFDARRTRHAGRDLAPHLERLVLEGVSRYWSRERDGRCVTLSGEGGEDGERWRVRVRAERRPERSQPFSLRVWRGRRSSPLPPPLRDRLPEGAREWLEGWARRLRVPLRFGSSNRFPGLPGQLFYWPDRPWPDADFARTAAHELGHAILYAAEGLLVSATHGGTSDLLQRPLPHAPVYPPPPAEIDLMHYFREGVAASPQVRGWDDYFARSVASEADVLRLLALAEVELRAGL